MIMNTRLIIIMVLILGVMCSCTPEKEIQADNVDDFIVNFENDLERYETAFKVKQWDSRNESSYDTLILYKSALRDFLGEDDLYKKAERFSLASTDEVIKRKRDIIYAETLVGFIEKQKDIAGYKDSIDAYFDNVIITGNRSFDDIYDVGRDKYRSDILVNNNAGDKYGDIFLSLIRKRNIAAKRLGYNSYYSLVLKTEGVSGGDIDSLCDLLLRETDSLYKYHLGRLNSPDSRNPGLFSYRRNLKNSIGILLNQNVQEDILEQSLKSIGFDINKLPIYYFYNDSVTTVDAFKAHVIYVPDDIRIAAHTGEGIGSLEGLIQASGLALYATGIDQDDYLFRRVPSPVWTGAIRYMFSRFIFEPEFLKSYLNVDDSKLGMWEDFAAYYKLVKLRYFVFQTLLEKELYTGSVTDVEKLYSDLFGDIFSSTAPPDIKAQIIGLYDRGYPIIAHNELLGLLTGEQIYQSIISANGNVIKNPATRHYLTQNCFRFGARYDWRELLKWATGEDLKAEYYINSDK